MHKHAWVGDNLDNSHQEGKKKTKKKGRICDTTTSIVIDKDPKALKIHVTKL